MQRSYGKLHVLALYARGFSLVNEMNERLHGNIYFILPKFVQLNIHYILAVCTHSRNKVMFTIIVRLSLISLFTVRKLTRVTRGQV